MLGNAHRPENANRLGFGNHVRDSSQRLLRQSRDPRSGSDGEGLETGSVLLEAVYQFNQKLGMGKSFVQQIATDRAEPPKIGTRIRVREKIGASRHLVLTQVGDDQLLPVKFMGALDPGRDDRMTFRRVAADDEDQIGFFDIGDRTRVAGQAHGTE